MRGTFIVDCQDKDLLSRHGEVVCEVLAVAAERPQGPSYVLSHVTGPHHRQGQVPRRLLHLA